MPAAPYTPAAANGGQNRSSSLSSRRSPISGWSVLWPQQPRASRVGCRGARCWCWSGWGRGGGGQRPSQPPHWSESLPRKTTHQQQLEHTGRHTAHYCNTLRQILISAIIRIFGGISMNRPPAPIHSVCRLIRPYVRMSHLLIDKLDVKLNT